MLSRWVVKSMCDSRYYPISDTPGTTSVPTHLLDILGVFEKYNDKIDSAQNKHRSDKVLSYLQAELQGLEYQVETSKKKVGRIEIPIHDGDGRLVRHINPDARHLGYRTIIEVEAGRAVDNNQYLKDLVWAATIPEVDYLALAVRKFYSKNDKKSNRQTTQRDYEKIAADLSAISHHLQLPLKGVLLIGY